MALSTNFKDDILADSSGKRKFNMINNDDGTVSFEDVTDYSQYGSVYGAKEIIEQREAINSIDTEISNHKKNVSSLGNILIATGSKYVWPNGTSSAVVFSKSKLDELFGVDDCENTNTICLFVNADGDADPLHIDGATYRASDKNWYAVFDRSASGERMRINYIAIYFGNAIS